MDLAFSRGALDSRADNKFMRGRIALLIFLPALTLVVMLAVWINSWIFGVAGYVLLGVGVWVFSERADQVVGLVRRLFPKKS